MAIEQVKGGRQKPKAEFDDFLKLFPDNVTFETYEDDPENPVKIEARFQLFIKIEKLTKGLIDLYQQQIKQELGLDLAKEDLAVLSNILQEQAVIEPAMIESLTNNIDRFNETQREIKKTESQIYNQLGFNSFTEGKAAIDAQLEKLDLSLKAQTKKIEKKEMAPLVEKIANKKKDIDSLDKIHGQTQHVHEYLLNNIDNDEVAVDAAALKIGLVNSPDFNFNALNDDELEIMVNELSPAYPEDVGYFVEVMKNKKAAKKSSPEFKKFYTEQLLKWELTDEETTQLYNFVLRNVWQKFEPGIIAGGIDRDNLFAEHKELKEKKKNKEDKKRLAELASQINRLDRQNNEFGKFSEKLNDNAQSLISDFLNNKFRFTDVNLQNVLEQELSVFILETKKTDLVKSHVFDYFKKADVSKMAMLLPDHTAQQCLLEIVKSDKQEKYGMDVDSLINGSGYPNSADRNFTYEFREAVLPLELESQESVLAEKNKQLDLLITERDRKQNIMAEAKNQVKTKTVPGQEKETRSRLDWIKNIKAIKRIGWSKYWKTEIGGLSEKLSKAEDLEEQRKTLQFELIRLRESFLYSSALSLEEVSRQVKNSVLDNINNFDPQKAELSELEKHARFIAQQKSVFKWDDLMDVDFDAAARERLVADQIYKRVDKEVAETIDKYNFKSGTVDALEYSIKKFLAKKEIGDLKGPEVKNFIIEKVKEIRKGLGTQLLELNRKAKAAKDKMNALQQKKNTAETDYDAAELAYQEQFGVDPDTGNAGFKALLIDKLETEITDYNNAISSVTAQINNSEVQLKSGLLDDRQTSFVSQTMSYAAGMRQQHEHFKGQKKQELDKLFKDKKWLETGLNNKKRAVDQIDKQLKSAEIAEAKISRDNASAKNELKMKIHMISRLYVKIKK